MQLRVFICVFMHSFNKDQSLMCPCSGPLECNDIKLFLGGGKGLEEDITCTDKNGKGEERKEAIDLILVYGLF